MRVGTMIKLLVKVWDCVRVDADDVPVMSSVVDRLDKVCQIIEYVAPRVFAIALLPVIIPLNYIEYCIRRLLGKR